jgi:hypothetical protein
MVTVLWGLDRLGLGGRPPVAELAFASGGATVAVAAAVVRDVAVEPAARRLLPLLALTPAAIWWSSADPFFAAVGALGVMGVVRATVRPRADGAAVLGGVAFALAAHLSYGLVLLALVPTAVAIQRRRVRPLVVAAVAALAVGVVVTLVTGFVWWDGLAATRERYHAGIASVRPFGYFLVGNLAVFAVMIGPAAVAGLTRRAAPATLRALLLGGIAAVAVADLSGMSKAEVERIWIPFVPWVVVAGIAVAGGRRSGRAWLAAQVLVTVVLAVGIRSPW